MTGLMIGSLSVPKERVIAESNLSFAVALANPLTKGHVVCLPKRHCQQQTDLTTDEFCDLYELATKIAKAVTQLYTMTGVTYIVNDVDDGGKKVGHLSLHVIPRIEGDFKGDSLSDILEQKPAFAEGLKETADLTPMTPELIENASELRTAISAH